MSVKVELELFNWDDILDTLYILGRINVREIQSNGSFNLYDGSFLYREEPLSCAGAEQWMSLRQYRRIKKKPWLVECEEAATLLWALFVTQGKDDAELRLLQFKTTVHVQVVEGGVVHDPSVKLGMKVPAKYKPFLYRLDYRGDI